MNENKEDAVEQHLITILKVIYPDLMNEIAVNIIIIYNRILPILRNYELDATDEEILKVLLYAIMKNVESKLHQ